MAVSRQRAISDALVHDQLYALDTTSEVCVEVARNRRESNFVLLVTRFLIICNVQSVSEDTINREKLAHKAVPVAEIVSPLRPLKR